MPAAGTPLTERLIEGLYAEAMLLADETRAYFDQHSAAVRESLPSTERVVFACEALKGTTRLMQVIAWLLTRRAIDAGDIPEGDPRSPQRKLGEAPAHVPTRGMPAEAARLLAAGGDLYDRVERLDRGIDAGIGHGPARMLFERLERSL